MKNDPLTMTTKEMQDAVATTGNHMRQEEYAGTYNGRLVSRHRWIIYTMATGVRICQGTNPQECFKNFLNLGWKPVQTEGLTAGAS